MKSIKVLALTTALFLFAASFAMGVDITISGTIAASTTIQVTPEADITDLDLTVDLANKKIATVVEKSNKRAGYTVTVTSANAAGGSTLFFKGSDALNADTVPYTLSYGGVPATFTAGIATVTDASAKTTKDGSSKDVAIDVGGSALYPNADTYSDTLTFTVTAK